MPVFAARYIVSGGGVVDTSDAAAMRTALGLGSAAVAASTAFALASHTQGPSTIAGATTTGQVLLSLTDGTFTAARLTAGSNVTLTHGSGSLVIAAAGASGGTIEQHVPLAAMYSTDRSPLLDWSTNGVTLPRARFTDGTESTATERLGFDIAIPSGAATTGNATISAAVAGLSASTGTIMLSIGSGSVGGSTYAMTRGTPVNVSSTVGNSVAATLTIPMADIGSPGQAKAGVVELTPSLPGDLRLWYGNGQTSGSTLTNGSVIGTSANLTVSGATWVASSPSLLFDSTTYSLSFNGSSAYAITDLTSSMTSANMSITAWYNSQGSTNIQTIFAMIPKGGYLGGKGLYLRLAASDQPQLVYGTGAGVLSIQGASGYGSNAWKLLSTTYDGSTLRLYVDSTLVASSAYTTGLQWANAAGNYPSKAICLMGGSIESSGGTAANVNFANGRIDDLRVYNRALSAVEISQLVAGKHEDATTQYTGGTLVGDGVLLSPGITIQYPGA